MSFYFVKAYHGPSTSFHTYKHKPHHLKGLQIVLQKMGYRVNLIPVDCTNYCMLEMCGHQIFRCNLQNLHFNTPANRDTVGQRAIQAVLESTQKFRNANNHLYFLSTLESEMFLRNKYAIKDYFLPDEEYKPYVPAKVKECTDCCGMFLAHKPQVKIEDQRLKPAEILY